ncbi:hypothetical protein SESBI_15923 [Sesbania bispinosa]|nr:hypothetical protein SESBI_15923 [Sesbania bispinosa]
MLTEHCKPVSCNSPAEKRGEVLLERRRRTECWSDNERCAVSNDEENDVNDDEQNSVIDCGREQVRLAVCKEAAAHAREGGEV